MRRDFCVGAIVALLLIGSGADARNQNGIDQGPVATATTISASAIDLEDLARICVGEVEILHHQDGYSGRAIASMVGGVPSAGIDSTQVAAAVAQLKRLADVDSSGEVTGDESGSLVNLILFGILEAQMATTYGADRNVVLMATGLGEADLTARESAYRALAARAHEIGFRLPGRLPGGE
jgi:hypothetical protein